MFTQMLRYKQTFPSCEVKVTGARVTSVLSDFTCLPIILVGSHTWLIIILLCRNKKIYSKLFI